VVRWNVPSFIRVKHDERGSLLQSHYAEQYANVTPIPAIMAENNGGIIAVPRGFIKIISLGGVPLFTENILAPAETA
jgi:hypothetical protein